MTVSELLPCPTPFCSAPEPYIERVGAHLYKARCKYCQVETEAQFNEAAAVEQWNTRSMKAAEPLQQGDEVERVAAALIASEESLLSGDTSPDNMIAARMLARAAITAIGSQSK